LTLAVTKRYPALPYIGPFLVFVAFLALADPLTALLGRWEFPFRVAILAASIWYFSSSVLSFRVVAPVLSILLGVAVFLIWVAPDALIPGYREHWLFQNAILGKLRSSIDPHFLSDPLVLVTRCIRAIVIVPIVEELFWRGWLMRWIIRTDFETVPMGTYAPASMWITALLFASEHGPYWEVGLAAGLLYNWWMVRTKNLGDCILAHAVTNGVLSLYVIFAHKWGYWM
jgi:CAAX prenyl protease-like protein